MLTIVPGIMTTKAKMVRLFIYVPLSQAEFARRQALEGPRGTTQSSVYRRAMDEYQQKIEAGQPAEGGSK